MCGIAAIIGNNPEESRSKIVKMLEAQRHRGPDAELHTIHGANALGHNRLSIISLKESANQPMESSCGRYEIIFNGEIYNYLELKRELNDKYDFKTESDTEVLLAAYIVWGEEMLHKLIGIFSFIIYNVDTKLCFGARDRFGVKPMYYAEHNGSFFFSSEIKALWSAGVPKTPNLDVWSAYFKKGSYGMPHESFWQDIHQLPGGFSFTLDYNKNLTINKWYNFEENVFSIGQQENDELIKERWTELAVNSIDLRFRSDVPVGFNISGGLDSSLLLSLVYQHQGADNPINAYTFYSNFDLYDELKWSKELISKINFPLNPVLFDKDTLPDLADKVGYHQDEPFGGFPTMAYANVFKEARENNVIVLLDGQGVDEALAGYDYYQQESSAVIQGVTKSPFKTNVLNDDFNNSNIVAQNHLKPFDDKLQNMQYRDLFYTKIPRDCRFNDRISMMHSTELREPFLDHRLVEYGFALPKDKKINNGQSKWIARQVAKSFISGNIALAPKRPLQTPQREWMQHDLKDWVRSSIEPLSNVGWFKMDEINKELNNYFAEENPDNSFFLWQWINTAMLLA